MVKMFNDDFIRLNISVLTVSDSRTEENDTSGDFLVDSIESSGHNSVEKKIVVDNIYKIRESLSTWIADDRTQVIIVTGGTGFTERDSTPEAAEPLFDKKIDGFGELFRQLSYETIGTSTIQSRATAGVVNGTYLFALPGSPGACRDGWDHILKDQLDIRYRPCNFSELLPRLREHLE